MSTKATVRMRVMIGVELDASVWGSDCTVGQVRSQGVEAGENAVRKALAGDKRFIVLGVESLEMTLVSEAKR